jgi:galactokinase
VSTALTDVTYLPHVPGRIELLGKHVDYLGGRSLTCATPWGLAARVTRVQVEAGDVAALLPSRQDVYARAVVKRLSRDFGPLRFGADVAMSSTLPPAAGMSSSSAYVIALLAALSWANDLPALETWREAGLHDSLGFAQYAAAVESGGAWGPFAGDDGVGTRGGAQDHIAILCNAPRSVGQFRYKPGAIERRVAWPTDWRLLVLHSGVVAEKTGAVMAEYNRIAAEGAAGGAERRRQFVRETEALVPIAADAIAAARPEDLAAVAAESQVMAERILRNQIPETAAMCRLAIEAGAFAASSFGAGFGGAVWALSTMLSCDYVLSRWRASYAAAFPGRGATWSGVMSPAGTLFSARSADTPRPRGESGNG